MKYLVIKCEELGDQWECDANRTPVCITDDYSEYDIVGYEIYAIKENGMIGKKMKEYDTSGLPVELIVYKYKEGVEEDYLGTSDIEIIESVITNYTELSLAIRKKIVNLPEFTKFVKKYLDTSNATVQDYKEDFLNMGCCDEFDYVCEDNGIIISLKQGNRVTRNY